MFVLDNGKRFVIPRTEMTYPGHSLKLHQNAADPVKSPVDHVMADFEDACPYEFKGEKSRKIMVEALNTLDFGKKVVTIRPNNIHSPFFKGDIEAIVLGAPNRFHGIILPKTRGPEEIREVSRLLDDLEKRAGWKSKIQIESLIETPHALIKAYEIATASDRMAGLIFGIADYAANLGIREIVENQNQNFHYSKQAVVVAAKAAGLHAVDNVYLRLWRKEDSPSASPNSRPACARRTRAPRISAWTAPGSSIRNRPKSAIAVTRRIRPRSITPAASSSSTTRRAAARWRIPLPAR